MSPVPEMKFLVTPAEGSEPNSRLFGQGPEVLNQLPDLVIGHTGKGHHAGACRSVFNYPIQLPVRNVFHRFSAGKVSRMWIQRRAHGSLSVPFIAMALFTGQGLSGFVIQLFSRLDVLLRSG